MKGLELSERFFFEYGEDIIKDVSHLVAVGLVGSGSECLGYDDEISTDHDFEAGFCIFLPSEELLDRKTAFSLERAYARLPREFLGFKRSPLSPVGGNRHGVIRTASFFVEKVGVPDGKLGLEEWFSIPEYSLLEATNGKIFFDRLGEFSKIREGLRYLPEDVRLKKLAGELLLMGQSGQYNYPRLIKRGDGGAARLAAFEFVKSALHAVFLLNKAYLPYYKWQFRALQDLPSLSDVAHPLERILSGDAYLIEEVTERITREAVRLSLTDFTGSEAEGHAYSVNEKIKDPEIRNLNILYGI